MSIKRIILIVVVVLILGFVTFAGISFFKARRTSMALGCECRLSCLWSAQEQYALEYGAKDGEQVDPDDVVQYMADGYEKLVCPVTKRNSYVFGKIGEKPRCTYHGTSTDCVNNF